ncbi:MAG: glucose-6-phosphate isomerase [Candidatus Tokpelaia sp. JSC189]|nr:MAG: glucose-6-phosphate isomerase [Candidatus Tokpelaia sp. JSC189]
MTRDESQFQAALSALKYHASNDAPFDIRKAFSDDTERFNSFSLKLDDLLFDFSKCAVSGKTLQLLNNLARVADIGGRRDAMFAGEPINVTENRPALHVALRAPGKSKILLGETDIIPKVQSVLNKMEKFSNAIRSGMLKGEKGHPFTDIVNIGIGGSDLGPATVTMALKPYHNGPACHFISNIDGAHISDTLSGLNPARTFFIIASKTLTTTETMINALLAREWIVGALGEAAVGKHFAAVSSALDKVADFGIDESRVFGFWSWVGGRYSVWGAIGLPVMLAIGPAQFRQLLAGAYIMDEHFRQTPLMANIPVMLGLIGFWHRVICNYRTRAVIPYEQRLEKLPAYLQQLDMESNGKCVTLEGTPVTTATGPVVWGQAGTNGQHAFFQLLHQGTDIIPIEFIIFVNGHESNLKPQHNILLANCLAQAKALLYGRSANAAYTRMIEQDMEESEAKKLAPHKTFPGNRPSITIMQDLLTPFALGRLLALYEHRVFVEGNLMNINSFDQWGVELGKELASSLLTEIESEEQDNTQDASVSGLLAHIHAHRR